MKLKIRKGDTVQIISGSDKGKKGEVLAIDPTNLQIKVQGVKVMTHFSKKDGQQKLEGFMDFAKVKLLEKSKADKKAPKKKAAKNA